MQVLKHSARSRGLIAAALAASALALSGCSGTGPDYGPGDREQEPAGAPAMVTLVPAGSQSLELPEGASVAGLSVDEQGRLLALIAPGTGSAGELRRMDADGRVEVLQSIAVDQAYRDGAAASPQIASGWTLGPAPSVAPDAVSIGTGTRFGVLRDPVLGPAAPGNYAGARTDEQGSPTGPVTGACGFTAGEGASRLSLTADGSSNISSRMDLPILPATGSLSVTMQAGEHLSVRSEQSAIAEATGPHARPRLTPGGELSVAGLRSLSCLDPAAVGGLHSIGVTEGLREGTGNAVSAVIDRQLADAWFDKGRGRHGELVGQATASGADRLDGVLIDAASGVAVAGLHLDLPEDLDAQVSALAFDASGTGGWAAVAGDRQIYRFEARA